jgi:2-polyprenyl-6-methoxyphenol hydroxylase-like FAD-dependent oxidoreductase
MRVVVLGAGISGHTAALLLRRKLKREHQVVVVSPKAQWNWIPSNIWVGVGRMGAEEVTFDLRAVYDKAGIEFIEARATEIHPEGDASGAGPYVVVEPRAVAGGSWARAPLPLGVHGGARGGDLARPRRARRAHEGRSFGHFSDRHGSRRLHV